MTAADYASRIDDGIDLPLAGEAELRPAPVPAEEVAEDGEPVDGAIGCVGTMRMPEHTGRAGGVVLRHRPSEVASVSAIIVVS